MRLVRFIAKTDFLAIITRQFFITDSSRKVRHYAIFGVRHNSYFTIFQSFNTSQLHT